MKKLIIAIAIIIAIASLTVVYIWVIPQTPKDAPDISLNIIDGRKIDFNSLRGKPLLVTFWATTCSTCLQEMPHLIALYHELNKAGFEIIGIAMSYDPPNHVVTYSKQKNIPYPIALDIDGRAARAFGNVSVTPTNFLIDPRGKIIQFETGAMNISNLRLKIRELLKTNKTTIS